MNDETFKLSICTFLKIAVGDAGAV